MFYFLSWVMISCKFVVLCFVTDICSFISIKYILKGNGKHLYIKTILKMKLIPSTMLDLARNPEDVFRAPLNTTKLAPVTDKKNTFMF